MTHIAAEPLFDMTLYGEPHDIGQTPYGSRRFVQVTGGQFEGRRLRGDIIPAGADVALIRADGVFEPNVHALLKTDDNALIHLHYRGRFHAPPSIMKRLIQRDPGVQRREYYLWNAVFFETAVEKYAWLNRILALSTGMPQARTSQGIGMFYEVLELL